MAQPEQMDLLVFLVEDNPADVFLVRSALRDEGLKFQLQVVEDGEKAIEALKQVDADTDSPCPNVLLLDLNLPKRMGEEVLETVRRSPRSGGIPVVVMTSSESPDDRMRAFELGATEYFRKPSNLDEFMRIGKVVKRLCARGAAA